MSGLFIDMAGLLGTCRVGGFAVDRLLQNQRLTPVLIARNRRSRLIILGVDSCSTTSPTRKGLWVTCSVLVRISAFDRGCVKMQMRDRRMVGRLAVFDCRISTDLLRSMSF